MTDNLSTLPELDEPVETSNLESRVDSLEKKVKSLEKKRNTDKRFDAVYDRVEDICDYLYGTNVRPPLTERTEANNNVPAEVKPSNEDD